MNKSRRKKYTQLSIAVNPFFGQVSVWVKKNNPKFDVTMGSFDGAEVYELVGLYLLNEFSNIIAPERIGLSRDDGLTILPNLLGPKTERLNKKIRTLFRKHKLNISIEAGLQQIDFLDVTLDLATGKYWPYK